MIINGKKVSLKDKVSVEMSVGEMALFAILLGENTTEDVLRLVEHSLRLKQEYTSELKYSISNEKLNTYIYNEMSNFLKDENIFV